MNTTKLTLYLVLAISSITALNNPLSAQGKGPKFGFKGGISLPLMKGENYFSTQLGYDFFISKSDAMVNGGLFLEIPVSKNFAIQPEVFYNRNGYSWYTPDQYSSYINPTSLNGTADPDMDEFLEFLSIPVLFKLKFGGFAIFAGPQYDLLLSAKRKVIADIRPEQDVKNEYQQKSWSAAAGLEYTLFFGLGFSARYQKGFTNIAVPVDNKLYEDGNEVKNNMVTLNMFFKFGELSNAFRKRRQSRE